MKQIILIITLISINYIVSSSRLELNDICDVARSKTKGICKFIENCEFLLNEIREESLFPSVCGFVRDKIIICCPVANRSLEISTNSIRKSVEKCNEYQKILINQTGSMDPDYPCPITVSSVAIVGGTNVYAREHPHMALLGYGEINQIKWVCGGSLISERFILTAAHCVNTLIGVVKYVLLGDIITNDDTDDADPHQFEVIERFIHPQYKRSLKYYDIALLKLNGSVDFSEYIRPICLPTSDLQLVTPEFSQFGVATGWGRTDYNQPPTSTLQKVQLQFYSHEYCSMKFENYTKTDRALVRGIDNDTQVCAGISDERKDTCQGDSGGPIRIIHPTVECMSMQIGITSFGVSCAAGFPGVYTRISYFLDWIENIVWP